MRLRHRLCVGGVMALAAVMVSATCAVASPPEFGRCLKVATGEKGKYSSSKCTVLAAEPKQEKYEWYAAFGSAKPVEKAHFTAVIKSGTIATLETKAGAKVTCTGESTSGVLTGNKTEEVAPVKFTGCQSGGNPCSSEGAASGEVVTVPLAGELGVEKEGETPAKNKIGNELSPKTGEEFVHFACLGVAIKVKGHVISPIKADSMLLSATIKFTATKGKQKPEKFLGGPPLILESSFAGGPFEQSGQTIATIQTAEEKLEVNTVV